MKIAIITPTCRPNPRLEEAARTIAAAVLRIPEEHRVLWVIVDERGRKLNELIAPDAVIANKDHVVMRAGNSLRLQPKVVPPISSKERNSADRLPAHNSARNSGLIEAARWSADYVVLLNDCNVVTPDFLKVALDCCAQGLGWSCKNKEVSDMKVPDDGLLKSGGGHHDLLRPIIPTSAPRAAWGAPMKYFVEVGGFDLAYDGQRKGNDIDCAIRMSRAGLRYVTTERAFTIQLRRTKQSTDVTTNREALNGAKNQARLNQLIRDKKRTQPIVGTALAGELGYYARERARSDQAPGEQAGAPAEPKLVVVGEPVGGPAIVSDARPGHDAAPLMVATYDLHDQPRVSPCCNQELHGGSDGDDHVLRCVKCHEIVYRKAPRLVPAATLVQPPSADLAPLTESENDLADEFDTGGF